MADPSHPNVVPRHQQQQRQEDQDEGVECDEGGHNRPRREVLVVVKLERQEHQKQQGAESQAARAPKNTHVVCTRGTGTVELAVTSMPMATKWKRDKEARVVGGEGRGRNHLSRSTATAQGQQQRLRTHASIAKPAVSDEATPWLRRPEKRQS